MTADALASLPENTDQPRPRPFGWLRRLVLRFLNPRRKLTAAEKQEINTATLDRARLKGKRFELAAEAEIFGAAIPQKLAQLGVCYKYRKGEGGIQRYKLVEFRRPFVLTEAAIYLEVDLRPGHLPPDVGIQHLEDPNTLRNLSQVIGHPVACRAPSEGGFWYIVEREFGVRGIPKHVDYNQMLLGRPATHSGLYLPLGVGENKRAIWKDLGQMPHMLVAGSTLSGKSNALNAFLCTLMRFNSSNRLQFVMVDLKGGVEFFRYSGVPHVWKVKHNDGSEEEAIIERREQVIPWFRRVLHQGERRMEKLKADGVKNIGEYNSKHARQPSHQWSHIIVIVDEWADILQDKEISSEANELMMNIASRLRAVGVHLIVCTQVPTAEVLSTRLKTNLPARLALSVPNIHASIAILGDGSAMGLEPQGRAILAWGKKPVTFQMPRVTEAVISAVVAQAKAKKFDDVQVAEHDVTDQEIFDWAINDNGGDLDYMALFNHFRYRRVTQDWAEAFCKRVEGEQVVVGATAYEVMAPAGRIPRRLLPIGDVEPEQASADTGPELDPLEPPALADADANSAGPDVSTGGSSQAVTHQEIWEWAVRSNGGSLAYKLVAAQFKSRGMSQPMAQAMCRQPPPGPVVVDGVAYAFLPSGRLPGRGMLANRLERVPDAETKPEASAETSGEAVIVEPDSAPEIPVEIGGEPL